MCNCKLRLILSFTSFNLLNTEVFHKSREYCLATQIKSKRKKRKNHYIAQWHMLLPITVFLHISHFDKYRIFFNWVEYNFLKMDYITCNIYKRKCPSSFTIRLMLRKYPCTLVLYFTSWNIKLIFFQYVVNYFVKKDIFFSLIFFLILNRAY